MSDIIFTENNVVCTIEQQEIDVTFEGIVSYVIDTGTQDGTANKIRVVNSLPLNPAEGDVCFDATDNGFYIGVD